MSGRQSASIDDYERKCNHPGYAHAAKDFRTRIDRRSGSYDVIHYDCGFRNEALFSAEPLRPRVQFR